MSGATEDQDSPARMHPDTTGKFEVTSPNGERYFVTTQPGHSIISLEWAGTEPNLQPFLVRKVAQPIATEGRSKRSAAA